MKVKGSPILPPPSPISQETNETQKKMWLSIITYLFMNANLAKFRGGGGGVAEVTKIDTTPGPYFKTVHFLAILRKAIK